MGRDVVVVLVPWVRSCGIQFDCWLDGCGRNVSERGVVRFIEIRDGLARHIESDWEIHDFCVERFGRPHKVFVGLDQLQPPSESDAPLVLLIPGGRARSDGQHYVLRELRVVCSIVQTAIERTSDPDDPDRPNLRLIKHQGVDDIEEFSSLVERCASSYLFAADIPHTQRPDNPDEIIYPWFGAYWTYSLQVRDLLLP